MKIGEFAKVVTGGTPSTTNKEYWDNGTIPWLQSGSCKNDIITKPDKYITELGLKNSSATMMPKDTVVIALTGATTGKVGLLDIEASANQSVTGILPNDKVLPKYLFYYLMRIRKRILHDSYGGAQPHISQGYVKNIEVEIPDMEYQKKIIKKLDNISKTINNRKKALNDCDLLINSLYKKSIQCTECEFKKLGEIGESIIGLTYKPENITNNGILVLRSGNIQEGKLDFEDQVRVDMKIKEKLLVKEKDILICSRNGSKRLVGKSALIPKLDEPMTFGAFMCVYRSNINEFLIAFFHSDDFRKQLSGSTTATINQITSNMLNNITVKIPPKEKMNQVINEVRKVEKLKEEISKDLDDLTELFTITLEKSF